MHIPNEIINKRPPKKIDFDTRIYENNIDYGEFSNVVRFSDFVRNSEALTYEQAEEKFRENLPKIAGYRYTLEDYPKEERFTVIDGDTDKLVLDIYEAIVLEKEKEREIIPENKPKDKGNRSAQIEMLERDPYFQIYAKESKNKDKEKDEDFDLEF